MIEFIKNKMTDLEIYHQIIVNKRLFCITNETNYQMNDDPKNRIFDQNKQGIFLELKRLLLCDYHYKVSSNFGKDLDKDRLSQLFMAYLMITKEEKKKHILRDAFENVIYLS